MAKGLVKLSKAQVREIVRLRASGLTLRAIAAMYKVAVNAIVRHLHNAEKATPPPYLRSTAPVYTPAFRPPARIKTREEILEEEELG